MQHNDIEARKGKRIYFFSFVNPQTSNQLKKSLQKLYIWACLSKKKCYFCTRNKGEVHTKY